MPTTPVYGWPIPAYTDAADGPGAFRAFGIGIESTLQNNLTPPTIATQGTLAALPATAPALGQQYLVTSGAGAGLVFVSTGSAWVVTGQVQQLLRVLGKAVADVVLQVSGITGQTGDLAQFLNSAGVAARITPRGAYIGPIAPRKVLAYDGSGNLTSVTITSADGNTTISTQTLTYTSGNLTQVVTVADGRTVTQALTYDGSGNLTLVTETVS